MLSDHYRGGMTERLAVVIVTSDPATGRLEVVGKDAAVIQVSVGRIPVLFRWPKQGEYWTIIRENGEWALEERMPDPDAKSLLSLIPGEAIVQAEKIWTPSGDYLLRASDVVGLDSRLDALEGQTLDARLDDLEEAAADEVKGTDVAIGTGASFADVVITDNLGTTAKHAVAMQRLQGTFVADVVLARLQATTTNTTTIRVHTRLAGNITASQTIPISYHIWVL